MRKEGVVAWRSRFIWCVYQSTPKRPYDIIYETPVHAYALHGIKHEEGITSVLAIVFSIMISCLGKQIQLTIFLFGLSIMIIFFLG